MTPVVVEISYAVIMVDTTLIARTRAMVQWWYGKQRNKLRSALLRK
jgi:hypothetical protein